MISRYGRYQTKNGYNLFEMDNKQGSNPGLQREIVFQLCYN
jgi:hypothetical protein